MLWESEAARGRQFSGKLCLFFPGRFKESEVRNNGVEFPLTGLSILVCKVLFFLSLFPFSSSATEDERQEDEDEREEGAEAEDEEEKGKEVCF